MDFEQLPFREPMGVGRIKVNKRRRHDRFRKASLRSLTAKIKHMRLRVLLGVSI